MRLEAIKIPKNGELQEADTADEGGEEIVACDDAHRRTR